MTGEGRRTIGRAVALAAVALLSVSAAVLTLPPQATKSPALPLMRSTVPSGQYFDYLAIILMENHNLCDVYYGNASQSPCGTTPTGAPYQTGLSDNHSIPLNDQYCGVNPSLPNYLCLSGGSSFGCAGYDGNPNSNACTALAWNSPNVVDRLVTGGVSWKAYMEDMTSNCQGTGSGNYAVRHDPFVYYNDIVSNTSRCSRVVPAGPSAGSDSTFLSDLNSTSTASNYMWLTPNTRNDAHDTSVAYGDAYLANVVPKILASPVFTSTRAALFIVYDEGYGHPTYATWAGPVVKRWYSSTTLYSHFSLLATIESNWNLPYLNATNDGAATSMSEFFTSATPDFTISANPTQLSLVVGHSGTSTIAVGATNGFNGTVALTNSSPPQIVTACTPPTVTPGGSSTCTLNGTAVGNYTVTITGTSGTLVHSVPISLTVSPTSPPPGNPTAQFRVSPTWPQVNGTVTFDASGSSDPNPNATLEYRWDWTSDGIWDTPWNASAITYYAYGLPGRNTARLEVRDSLARMDNATQMVTVDSEPPVTTATLSGASGSNGWYRNTVTVTLSARDDLSGVARVAYSVDGASWQTYTSPVPVTSDGNHSVRFNATDNAGNPEAVKTTSIRIDASPPVTVASLRGTLNGSGSYVGSVNVSLAATDGMSGMASISYRIDGGSLQTYASTFVVSGAGSHAVDFSSTDIAGNVETMKSVSFTIAGPSGSPPVTALGLSGQLGSNSWYTSAVNISLNATGNVLPVTIAYRLDGSVWQTYTLPFSVADGIHTLDYNATDATGNAEAMHTVTFKVDTTPPRTTAILTGTAGQNRWYTSVVSLNLSSTDATSGVASTEYRLDGGAWLTYTAPIVIGDGRHILEYRATDVAGVTEAIASTAVNVDSSPPHLTVSPSGGVEPTSTFVVSWSASDDVSGLLENTVSLDGVPYAASGQNTSTSLTLADGEHTIGITAIDAAGNRGWANVTLRVDTNLFSPTGPLQGMPTYILVVLAASATLFVVLRRRARSRRVRRQQELARMRARAR